MTDHFSVIPEYSYSDPDNYCHHRIEISYHSLNMHKKNLLPTTSPGQGRIKGHSTERKATSRNIRESLTLTNKRKAVQKAGYGK